MEGIAMELVCYSMINILSDFEQSSLTFGAILSYLYLIYFLASNIYTYLAINQIYPKLKEQQELLKAANEAYIFPPTTTVDQVVNYSELKYAQYDLFLQEYKANVNPLLLYTPFINLCRLLMIVFCLFCFSRSGIVQVFCTLAVEISYIVFVFKSAVRTNKYEHILILFTQAGYILYNFLSLLTFLPVAQNNKQLYIGFTMAATIIAVTYVTLIYVSIIFVYKCVYKPIQWIYNRHQISVLKNAKKNKNQQQKMIWNDSVLPVKEEAKQMTVLDMLMKKQDQDIKNEQRMKIKQSNLQKHESNGFWHDGEGDESLNLNDKQSPNGKLNAVHPAPRNNGKKVSNVKLGDADGKGEGDDHDENTSMKSSVMSHTQNTAPHALKKARYKKQVLKNQIEKDKKGAPGAFTFSRIKKKDL